MTYLPDVNVWIALASDQHVHHSIARQWAQELETDQLAFCRITELGFLRLLTNRHVMGGGALDPPRAWRIYDLLRADPRIVFLPEQHGFTNHWRRTGKLISGGPNAWTDGYLAAFGGYEHTTIVTFDRRFKSLTGCSVLTLPPTA